MVLARESVGGAEVLRASGSMTRGVDDRTLRDALRNLIRDGCRQCVLDLSQVPFLDSAALGETVAGLTRFHAVEGHLAVVVSRGSEVDRVIRLTALDRVLDVHHELGSALAGRSR